MIALPASNVFTPPAVVIRILSKADERVIEPAPTDDVAPPSFAETTDAIHLFPPTLIKVTTPSTNRAADILLSAVIPFELFVTVVPQDVDPVYPVVTKEPLPTWISKGEVPFVDT